MKGNNSMENDVPFGGEKLVIDKIGLRIPTNCFNKIVTKGYQYGVITILHFGNVSQINIHPEFLPFRTNHARRCLDAIILLLLNKVFSLEFSLTLTSLINRFSWFLIFNDNFVVIFLEQFFQLVEIENAFDFYDITLFENANIFPGFRGYKNTLYSLDGKTTRRNRNGTMVSKGHQQSTVAVYNRGLKTGSSRLITRLEIREQGKHKKHLAMNMLNGNTKKVYENLKPTMKKTVDKKSIINLPINPHWINRNQGQFSDFLNYLDDSNNNKSTQNNEAGGTY